MCGHRAGQQQSKGPGEMEAVNLREEGTAWAVHRFDMQPVLKDAASLFH